MHFIEKFGCIEVIEDIGREDRRSNVANHTLDFVLCDLSKMWNQPVADCLIHRSLKSWMLVNFFIDVLDSCHNARLDVVATMSKPLNIWAFLQRYLSSGFRVKKL